ncbi:MAG: ABC transporter permease [Phycisphaerae bacterium]|nr:ABC transporter permease [Phycisphaerae bacterium]
MLLRTLLSVELFALGLRDLRAHKLRSLLTALGVIFGVAAVICMLSIGEAASAEQLAQIRLLGSQNIILRSVEPPKSQQVGKQQDMIKKYGLTRDDVERLRTLPNVADLVLLRDVADTVVYEARQYDGHVLGATENFFKVVNVQVRRGRPLTGLDSENRAKVCVIGWAVARNLFPNDDPLGRTLTVQARSTGPVPYTVVGILGEVLTAGNPTKGLAARDLNRDVYVPLATADLRYGDTKVSFSGMSREVKSVQFSDIYVHVEPEDQVLAVSRLVERVLQHNREDQDFTITVPLELLQQAEQVKRNSQIVLGSIAGISLLVGGIGIMNIMLASVTERTREIGIRRALGAKRYHITAQFLVQTLILSVLGGLIGIALGIGLAHLVTLIVNWQTIIPLWGVLLSFGVSAFVGLVFGLYPARAAARLDPIDALNSAARTA